jgi:very-short-patch-repair endonuclease
MSRSREQTIDRSRRGVTVNQAISPTKLARAREFRKAPTDAEARTWALLRNRGILGLKFRRQQIIDGFIVDFYCAKHRLILEVDGEVHRLPDQASYDEQRDEHLKAAGFLVLRIPNHASTPKSLTAVLREFLKTSVSPERS